MFTKVDLRERSATGRLGTGVKFLTKLRSGNPGHPGVGDRGVSLISSGVEG